MEKEPFGCNEQLFIKNMIMENRQYKQKNLIMACTNNRKKIDWVPYEQILKYETF